MYLLSNKIKCAIICMALAVFVPVFVGSVAAQVIVADKNVYNSVQQIGKSGKGIKAFYASVDYKPIWAGPKNKNRRRALYSALNTSGDHGLPVARYKLSALKKALNNARSGEKLGTAEIMATKTFLQYAHDISSGAVNPRRIDKDIAIKRPRRSDHKLLTSLEKSDATAFMKSLAPRTKEYQRLLVEKKKLIREVSSSASNKEIPSRTLRIGMSGKSVVLLRKRLKSLGYANLGNSTKFDEQLKASVISFQKANGLNTDGVAGSGTIGYLNQGPKQRLIKVLVNLERERWMNFPRGKRHIFVNQASFTVYVKDNGKASFETRAVIGTRDKDRRTPEFYDEMTHMVINPTWHVPSSIAGKEYLPILRKNPGFFDNKNMVMISKTGENIHPTSVDLSQYSEKNFPFSIKQRPDPGNALGRVKFMFPNRFNIYLHDTPSKSLFLKDVRAFSHGCVRLQKPLEFAYKLLEKQTSNPITAFSALLETGKEQYVNLAKPIPVYLTYRTAYFGNASKPSYFPDIYGRDKKIFKALSNAGVSLGAVRS